MSSKGKLAHSSLVGRWTLAIMILFAVVWWASANALARDADPVGSGITVDTISSSLQQPRFNKVPYLVIGIADRGGTLPYGSFGSAGDEATNRFVGNTTPCLVGPATSGNRNGIASGPLVLSSLLNPTVGVPGSPHFGPEPTHQTIHRSPNLTGAHAYSLLEDGPAPGTFLYACQANYFPSKQWPTDSKSFYARSRPNTVPLLQLEFNGWGLPVMLSSTGISR
jgi:hypothetical protein